jgi:hypothetical protein
MAVTFQGAPLGAGPGNLPSKTWHVNCGGVLAANIAADLSAGCRLLGLYDCDDPKDAEPDTLCYRCWHNAPAWYATPGPIPGEEPS